MTNRLIERILEWRDALSLTSPEQYAVRTLALLCTLLALFWLGYPAHNVWAWGGCLALLTGAFWASLRPDSYAGLACTVGAVLMYAANPALGWEIAFLVGLLLCVSHQAWALAAAAPAHARFAVTLWAGFLRALLLCCTLGTACAALLMFLPGFVSPATGGTFIAATVASLALYTVWLASKR
ncbi:hypothetical protein KRX56_01435 [Dermabacteraceae bacterium TAE3-ERU27]|nr:hypothetical protein [Dermabacteraceae bacterium TAE3-ERU27]